MKKTVLLGLALLTAFVATGANAQDRLRIVTNSDSYKLTIKGAENFAARTNYSTPVVEVIGSKAFEQLCQAQFTPDVVVTTAAIPSEKKEVCARNGVKELVITTSDTNIYIYTKKGGHASPEIEYLISSYLKDDDTIVISKL
jgi:hypothetical protein